MHRDVVNGVDVGYVFGGRETVAFERVGFAGKELACEFVVQSNWLGAGY